jgi:RNA polymerase sigma-70 factor (ECF subfamily)
MRTTTDVECRFNEIYAQWAGKVFAYFSVGFGPDNAEDLAQQTFLNVWKYLNGYRFVEPDSWRAWIFHTARNVRNDFLRSRMGQPTMVEFDETLEVDDGKPPDDLMESICVKTAWRRLRQEDQDLLMYKEMGLTSSEVGDLLDLSGSAVRSRMQHARERFRQALEDCGVNVDE